MVDLDQKLGFFQFTQVLRSGVTAKPMVIQPCEAAMGTFSRVSTVNTIHICPDSDLLSQKKCSHDCCWEVTAIALQCGWNIFRRACNEASDNNGIRWVFLIPFIKSLTRGLIIRVHLLLIRWMYHQHLSGIHPNTGQTSLQENAQSLMSPSFSHFLSCFSNHQSTHKGGLSRIDSWVQLIFEDKQLYNNTNTLLKPTKSSVPLLWVSQYTYLWNCREINLHNNH